MAGNIASSHQPTTERTRITAGERRHEKMPVIVPYPKQYSIGWSQKSIWPRKTARMIVLLSSRWSHFYLPARGALHCNAIMAIPQTDSGSSTQRTRRYRQRRHRGMRCVTVEVSQSEVAALEARGYLSEEERDDGAAIKKAIEGVLSDLVFELQSETAERTRARV